MTGEATTTDREGEVATLAEALMFGATTGSVEEGRLFRESIARRLLNSTWLADRDRATAARTLREAADAVNLGDHTCFKPWCPQCAMRHQKEWHQMDLRARADRIEATP